MHLPNDSQAAQKKESMKVLQSGVMQGMSIDDSELREYTHGLFGSMAGILKQDFQPFLATCVAAALASCEQVSQQRPLSCLTSHTHACAALAV